MKKSKADAPPPIYTLPHTDQVDLLAQALLREFMHRKKFSETLSTFDAECPRTEKTVSSRAVMSDLMEIPPPKVHQMKESGYETFMEILCCDRLEKRKKGHRTAELQAKLREPLPEIQAPPPAAKATKQKKTSKGDRQPTMTLEDLLETKVPETSTSKPKKVKEEKEGGKTAKEGKHSHGASQETESKKSAKEKKEKEKEKESDSSSDSSSSEEEEQEDPTSKGEVKLGLVSKRQGWSGDFTADDPNETLGITTSSSPSPHKAPAPTTTVAKAPTPKPSAVQLPEVGKDGLGLELSRELRRVFVGGDRRLPDSFIRQGFTFSDSVDYGLVQNEGGPCGLLAVVQAYLLVELRRRSFIFTKEALPLAVAKSLSQCLLRCSPSDGKVKIAVFPEGAFFTPESARSVSNQLHTIASAKIEVVDAKEDVVTRLISNILPQWSDVNGIGLLAFMLSLVLTRGLQRVCADMDIETPLIVEHGYCSQELTNLALCGRAVSGVHDGEQETGSMKLQGLPERLHVGFLTFMEVRGLVKAGNYAKQPSSPVWIIFNESHYSVLFAKSPGTEFLQRNLEEGGAAGDPIEFDLFYYDQQGQRDEIRLSVRCDSIPLPAQRKGTIVPFLNSIIRTVPFWRLAKIDWNGTDPLY